MDLIVPVLDVALYEMISKRNVFGFRVLERIVTYANNTFWITIQMYFLRIDCVVSQFALNPNYLWCARSNNHILNFCNWNWDKSLLSQFSSHSLSSNNWIPPVVLFRSRWHPPRYTSENAWIKNLFFEWHLNPNENVPLRYRKIFLTAFRWGSLRFNWYLA